MFTVNKSMIFGSLDREWAHVGYRLVPVARLSSGKARMTRMKGVKVRAERSDGFVLLPACYLSVVAEFPCSQSVSSLPGHSHSSHTSQSPQVFWSLPVAGTRYMRNFPAAPYIRCIAEMQSEHWAEGVEFIRISQVTVLMSAIVNRKAAPVIDNYLTLVLCTYSYSLLLFSCKIFDLCLSMFFSWRQSDCVGKTKSSGIIEGNWFRSQH
jgi:hypothetical protein